MSDQDMHGHVSVGSSSKVVGPIPHVGLLTALFTHTHTRVCDYVDQRGFSSSSSTQTRLPLVRQETAYSRGVQSEAQGPHVAR